MAKKSKKQQPSRASEKKRIRMEKKLKPIFYETDLGPEIAEDYVKSDPKPFDPKKFVEEFLAKQKEA